MNARAKLKIVQSAQEKIKTEAGTTFHNSGNIKKMQTLFRVNAGVDLADALESLSDMLDQARTPVLKAAMGEEPLKDNEAWLVNFMLQAAQAIVDSLFESAARLDETRHFQGEVKE